MSKKLNVKGADPRLESLFDYFVSRWPSGDAKTRDIWADRIRKAASQPGFQFHPPALRRFLVYILVGSKKYSALASVKKKVSSPRKNEISKIIIRTARLIDRKHLEKLRFDDYHAALKELSDARYRAGRAAEEAVYAGGGGVEALDAATYAADAACTDSPSFYTSVYAVTYARKAAAYADVSAWGPKRKPPYDDITRDYAAALLYFVEQEAYGSGKRRGNPASEKVPSLERLLGTRKTSRNAAPRSANPKTAKKTAKRKAPLAKTLISKCQKAWDHYCASPSKKRLKEVFDHLEVMKESSAKTVKDERARCLRAANKEAKRLGMK